MAVPCYNESEVFPCLREALSALADTIEQEFRVEIVLVDDGSQDDTWAQIRAFAARDVRVRGVALSRNFGHQMALTCAYDCAGRCHRVHGRRPAGSARSGSGND